MESLKDAATNDHLFPEKSLAAVKEANLLTVCKDTNLGGHDLGLVAGAIEALLKILKFIGSGILVTGRILKGHFNAQLLVSQFGLGV